MISLSPLVIFHCFPNIVNFTLLGAGQAGQALALNSHPTPPPIPALVQAHSAPGAPNQSPALHLASLKPMQMWDDLPIMLADMAVTSLYLKRLSGYGHPWDEASTLYDPHRPAMLRPLPAAASGAQPLRLATHVGLPAAPRCAMPLWNPAYSVTQCTPRAAVCHAQGFSSKRSLCPHCLSS